MYVNQIWQPLPMSQMDPDFRQMQAPTLSVQETRRVWAGE